MIGCVYSETVNVKAGTDYTFTPAVKGKIDEIDWRYQENIMVEWDRGSQPEPHWYKYKERATLNTTTGDFTLKRMKTEDSGDYKGQFTVNKVLQYFEAKIKVIGK